MGQLAETPQWPEPVMLAQQAPQPMDAFEELIDPNAGPAIGDETN
jgi:hypothetical protein